MNDVRADSVGPASDVPGEKAIGATVQPKCGKRARIETREVRDRYS